MDPESRDPEQLGDWTWLDPQVEGYCPVVVAPESPSRKDTDPYIAVTGRRWRGERVDVPDELRAPLVSELIAARLAADNAGAFGPERVAADQRVGDAQRALGEYDGRFDEARADHELVDDACCVIRALLRTRSDEAVVTVGEVNAVLAANAGQSVVRPVSDAAHCLACDGVVEWGPMGHLSGGRLLEDDVELRRGPVFD